MQRARRRLLSLAVVACAATGAIALAATGTDATLTVSPSIRVIKHTQGQTGSAAVTVTNPGATAFNVGSITYNCGAAPAMQLMSGSGSAPFQLGPLGNKAVVIECPAGLPLGMQRCTFTVNDGSNTPVVSFLGVCETDGMPVLAKNPATAINFGGVAVGVTSPVMTVQISNSSAMAVQLLQLQLDDDNFLLGSPCSQNETGCDATIGIPPMSSTTIQLMCKPTKTGSLAGKLFVTGANGFFLPQPVDVQCTGTTNGGPVLTVTPASVNLTTPVEVIDPATDQAMLQLKNGGSGSLAITSVSVIDRGVPSASNDWTPALTGACTMLPCPLTSSDTLVVGLVFNPSAFGPRPATLVINYNDGNVKQATVNLDAIGQGATLELVGGTTNLAFGVVPLNTPGMRSFTLKNVGNRPTTAMLATSPMAPFMFPASVVVTPGANPVVTVTCRSSSPISVSGQHLGVSSPDVTTLPFSLTLDCDVRDTQLTSNPTALALGEILGGPTPQHEPFQILRVGTGPAIPLLVPMLQTSNPKLSLGGLSQMMTTAELDLEIDVSSEGPIDDSIVIASSQAGIMPIDIPITGTVVTASANTPAVTSLGTFCVGQPTTPSILTLESVGTATLDLPITPAMMSSPSPFDVRRVMPSVYPAMLSPMGTATVELTPMRGSAAGDLTDKLQWTTAQLGVLQSEITATFVANGGAIAPSTLSFGSVPIRVAVHNAQQVTLQNCDTTTLEVMPSVPLPFELDEAFPTTLMPGEKATFSIAFHPTKVGHFEELLTVTSKAGDMFLVGLAGDGVTDGSSGDDTGSGDGLTSFYACSCRSNDPSGVLVIAFAGMCALVPRRRRRRR
jgi:hypothetical protein